jgi:hypothetical protein
MEKLTEFLAFCRAQDVLPVPVVYLSLEPPPASTKRVDRLAESRFYRASRFDCHDFYKPISRIVPRTR